jgi:hypothetical protein
MKCIVAVLVLAALASATTLDSFRSWSKSNGKSYTLHEEARRFAIFKENLAIAERLNLENHGAHFGMTKFMDLTNAEFKAEATTTFPVRNNFEVAVIPDTNADSADYTYMLPEIKDQAQCGSCWAFSAIANAEGQTYMTNGGKVVSLSEQALVSCDKMDSACTGGSMVYADMYLIENGAASEEAYPYVSGSGSVPKCKAFTSVAEFSSYKDFSRVSADATIIKYLDQYGPISVGIEADKSIFQLYTSGIIDSSSCGTNLDHGVTLVGYGTESSKNFWLVRNSWGKSWGDKGMVKIVRGKNMCGINGMISTIIA